MRKKIWISSDRIPGIKNFNLEAEFEVFYNTKESVTKDYLKDVVKEYHGVLSLLRDRFDEEVLENKVNLEVISNYAVGFDNIDIKKAKELGIVVTNTPDVLTNATAELTIALIFALARRIVEADKFTREGKFEGWLPDLFLGLEISGSTIGIVGAGRIGTYVGLKAYNLGMKVLYYSKKTNYILENLANARKANLEEIFKESDFITLHLPLTSETYHIVDERLISLMKRDAFLINVARGPVVDEKALIRALIEGRIAGAGFDVYEKEPHIPQELTRLENVILLPHIGSATRSARLNMSQLAVKNLVNVLKGLPPITRVI